MCSLVDGIWVTKSLEGNKGTVVEVFDSREGAIKEAEEVMKTKRKENREDESGMENEGTLSEKTGFEEEVEAVLEDVDTDSVEAVGDALSD